MIKNLTILYVEDDEIVRENFSEILQRYFSKVITAPDGKVALELYAQHKPDVALLDISIPYVSGLQVASQIREVDSKIQIIMLTAFADQDKLLKAVNLQLFAYLVKPVQLKKFDITMKNLLLKFKNNEILYLSNEFSWNMRKRELYYKNKKIKLTNNERLTVEFLCANSTQYFKACDIAFEILKDHSINDAGCNNIVQMISRFKTKILLELDIKDFFIENIYGAGYKIAL